MIKRNLKKWENISDMQGMLYFVQRMDELLFHYSMDTYKVPTLNVKLLLQEYLNTVDSIKEGQLKDKNEVPVFEEIVWCLENDKIAQRVIGQSICEEFLKNNGSYDKGMKRKVCQLFLDKLTGKKYLEELEEELRNVIINNSKKQIDSYARNFVRELTVLGYNSRYIFSRLNKIFYNSAVSDFSSMDMFFECFECKNKNYSVYLTIDKELAKFSGLLGEKLPQDSFCVLEDDDIPRGIQKIDGYNVVEIKNIRAYDEYSAYESAKNVIGLLDHFYSFFRYTGNGVYKNGFVKSDSGIKFIKEEVSGAERAKRTKSFEKSSLGALDLFNKATMNYENLYKLSRIMEIHNMALGIKSPSNVLLGLWSILELLLEKGETDNDHSRIFNIIDLVLPYLKNSYVEKLTLNLLLDLRESLGLTMMFISHELTVVEHVCDEIVVMYLGTVVEKAPTKELFLNILHPYTQALISAKPKEHPAQETHRIMLEGEAKSAMDMGEGCKFAPRCRFCQKGLCDAKTPKLREIRPGHFVACHRVESEEK